MAVEQSRSSGSGPGFDPQLPMGIISEEGNFFDKKLLGLIFLYN